MYNPMNNRVYLEGVFGKNQEIEVISFTFFLVSDIEKWHVSVVTVTMRRVLC